MDDETFHCPNCGRTFPVATPYLSRDYQGFVSDPHEPCGKAFTKAVVSARSEEKKALWRKIGLSSEGGELTSP